MRKQAEMRVDSCGIFRIGPWQGVRLIYDCSLLEIPAPPRDLNNSMVMEEIKDDTGKVFDTKSHECHEYDIKVSAKAQGYLPESYLPKSSTGRDQYVKWNFDYVAGQGEYSAVAEFKKAMGTNQNMLLKPPPDFSTGASSWYWDWMPTSKQKLVK